jgi:iron complex transport system substrate-binding protein
VQEQINGITGQIIDASVRLHMDLGPGLLESVYQRLLAQELLNRGLSVERQKPIRLEYKGVRFDEGFRVDLLVNGMVVVELKSIEKIADVHLKQILTYIRLLNLPVGLLLNFGAPLMRDGIHRVVNNFRPSAPLRL